MKISELKKIINEEIKNQKVVTEDWDNYKTLEEIEKKYLSKLQKLLDIRDFDGRIFDLENVFKTALKDAYTLGSVDTIKNDNNIE